VQTVAERSSVERIIFVTTATLGDHVLLITGPGARLHDNTTGLNQTELSLVCGYKGLHVC